MVLSSGLGLASVGGAIGRVGVFALRGYTRGRLYEIEPTGPLSLLGGCLTLLTVTP